MYRTVDDYQDQFDVRHPEPEIVFYKECSIMMFVILPMPRHLCNTASLSCSTAFLFDCPLTIAKSEALVLVILESAKVRELYRQNL